MRWNSTNSTNRRWPETCDKKPPNAYSSRVVAERGQRRSMSGFGV